MTVENIVSSLPDITQRLPGSIPSTDGETLDRVGEILAGSQGVYFVNQFSNFKGIQTPKIDDIDTDFFGPDIYPEKPSVFFQERMGELEKHGLDLTARLADGLCVGLPKVPLFDSLGAVVKIDKEGRITDSYYDFENTLSGGEGESPVSAEYNHNQLLRMAFEKAYFHHLMGLVPTGTPLHTSMVQAWVTKMLKGKQQFRGGYHNLDRGETFGNSASSLNEKVVEAILEKFYPGVSIEEHCERHKCNPCDLLAGIGDEIMSRLLSLEHIWDREGVIRGVADDIKTNAEKDSMGLLH